MSDIKHLQCMEVWGGNRSVDSGVIMPGVDAWVFSQPCENQAAGGDVHYLSTCCGGKVVRMVVADIAGHGARVAETHRPSRRWPSTFAPRERDQKHIAGSLGIPLNHLMENTGTLVKDRSLLVYCAGGYRSSIAASLLQSRGFHHVSEIAGGIAGWEAAKLPVQTSEA